MDLLEFNDVLYNKLGISKGKSFLTSKKSYMFPIIEPEIKNDIISILSKKDNMTTTYYTEIESIDDIFLHIFIDNKYDSKKIVYQLKVYYSYRELMMSGYLSEVKKSYKFIELCTLKKDLDAIYKYIMLYSYKPDDKYSVFGNIKTSPTVLLSNGGFNIGTNPTLFTYTDDFFCVQLSVPEYAEQLNTIDLLYFIKLYHDPKYNISSMYVQNPLLFKIFNEYNYTYDPSYIKSV